MKTKLNNYEKRIEDAVDKFVSVSEEGKQNILKHAAKTKTISLRINETVLKKIKEKTVQEGLSYQTLISSILYKYSTDNLLDKQAINSVINALKK